MIGISDYAGACILRNCVAYCSTYIGLTAGARDLETGIALGLLMGVETGMGIIHWECE